MSEQKVVVDYGDFGTFIDQMIEDGKKAVTGFTEKFNKYPHNTLLQAVANMHAAQVVKSYMEANISIEEIRSTLENQFLSNAVRFGHSTANAANLLAHCDIQANAAILRRLKRGF